MNLHFRFESCYIRSCPQNRHFQKGFTDVSHSQKMIYELSYSDSQSLKPLLPKMILIRAPNGFVMLKIFSRPIQYSNGFGVPYNIIYNPQLWKTTTHKKLTYLGKSSFAKTISIFIPSSIKIFFSVETSLNNCPCASKIKHTINPFGCACWEAYFESNFRNSRTIVYFADNLWYSRLRERLSSDWESLTFLV